VDLILDSDIRSGSTGRRNRLKYLTEPAGYIDGANRYQFIQSSPLDNVDPDGRDTKPGSTSRPTTQPSIAGQGETIVGKPTSITNWRFPYTCDVPGSGSGLFRYGPAIKQIAGEKGLSAFADALGLTPFDLAGYGYASIADVMSVSVRRDSDSCVRTAKYIEVSEFIAVPKWDDLYDWEKERIQKSPAAYENYPKEDTKMPNPAVGLAEWKAIRELMNKAKGVVAKVSDPGELNRLNLERKKNMKRIILDPGTWSKPQQKAN